MKKVYLLFILLTGYILTQGQTPLIDTVNIYSVDTAMFCTTDSVFVYADTGYVSYSWNTGDTTSGIWVFETDTYKVTFDSAGSVVNDSVYINLISGRIIQNDTLICYGDSITLNVKQKLPDCLIAYYPFNGNSNDESGNGYHLYPFGAVLVTDRFGHPNSAFSFNGVDSYMIGSIGLRTGSLAFALWFRAPDTSNWYPENMFPTIFDYSNGQLRTSILGLYPDFINGDKVGRISVDHYEGDGSPNNFQFETVTKPEFAEWHHLYVVYDTSAAPNEIWIDGVRQAQSWDNPILNPVKNLIYFGRSDSIQKEFSYFVGRLDDISIYTCPLDTSEIQALYRTGSVFNYYYSWSTGDTMPAIAEAPKTSTTYYAYVTDSLNYCVDSITVTVNPELKLDLEQIDMGCPGEKKATMLAHVSGGTAPYLIEWDKMILYLQGDTLALGLTDSVDYSITVTDTVRCKIEKDFQVDAKPLPQVEFTYLPEEVYFQNPVVTFTSKTTDASTWYWTFGKDLTSILENPVQTFPAVDSYDVTLRVTGNNGCIDSLTQIIEVKEVQLVIPNIFTPNGDGINDTFVITDLDKYLGNSIVIYNRWGKKVYEKNNYISGEWDGGNLSDGTYYFVLKCIGYFSNDEFKGTINIFKAPLR
ncbi:MAG: gliding motility-associated C-terminal domain-containing protein [Bacteroidetes bacterium]|nr:gliding motility-associated C-terminal domain-containing protein [Bacteroidota bacterium]